MELIQYLADIHNKLLTISTSGEDTITMAQCLLSLRDIVQNIQKEEQRNGVQQIISTDNREQDTSVLPGQN
jgi:hypothetical protein